MPNSEYISDEELQQLIAEAMIREQQESTHAMERPYLYAPAPLPPPERFAEENTSESRKVIIIDI
jgi:hypothetical protein